MKAIILTAGFGNRMRPLTLDTHKTLLKVGSRTVIQRIIDSLVEQNIFDIVLVTGYLASELQEYISKTFPDLNVSYIHNSRYAQTNNIYSLALAFENIEIDDDIILIESDLIYDPSVLQRLIKSPYKNVALVDKYRSGMDGTVVTIENDIITNVIPPHLQEIDFNFEDKYKTLNIYKFSKPFCESTFKRLLTYYARVIDDNCYYELVLGILIYMQREVIYAEKLDHEQWAEMDDPNDLTIAKFIFEESAQNEILDRSFGGYWNYDILDFCFIRNMYFPSNSILSELKGNLHNLLHNYGSTQSILNQKLAYFLLWKKEHLTVLNGASQIYPFLQEFFADKRGLVPSPTFGEYARVFPEGAQYKDDMGVDLNELELASKDCDVVVLVSPNNPSGSVISTEWIHNFAKKHSNKFVIVDESFIEFASEPSIVPLLEESLLNNVIVVKSLSKSLGVPGIRLGYVYSANKEFNSSLASFLPIWNLNSVAEYFLEIILKHRNELNASFEATIADRDHFQEQLATLTAVDQVFASQGNYILVRLKGDMELASQVVKNLLSQSKIYVKNISGRFDQEHGYLRIAVRLPSENAYFVTCLESVYQEITNAQP